MCQNHIILYLCSENKSFTLKGMSTEYYLKGYITAMAMALISCGGGQSSTLMADSGDCNFIDNAIRIGEGEINVTISPKSPINIDDVICEVTWTPLLDNVAVDTTFRVYNPVQLSDGHGMIPMETARCFTYSLQVIDKNDKQRRLCSITVGLDQESPLNVALTFNDKRELSGVEQNGGAGYVDPKNQRNSILMEYGFTYITDKAVWEDYNRLLKWELDTMMPANLREALKNVSLSEPEREWVISSLTRDYCGRHILPYEKRARTWGYDFTGADTTLIRQPNKEFYRELLNDLDYSTAMLGDYTHTLRGFFNNILTDIPVGIKPIGETPIAQWKEDVTGRLNGIIDNPTDLFLDLLTATAYMQQIQIDKQPLTDQQIANINEHYKSSDLGRIILNRNFEPFPHTVNVIWQ